MWPHLKSHAMLQARPLQVHCSAEMRPSEESAHVSPQKQICSPPAQSACNEAARCCQIFLSYAMLALTEIMGFLDATAMPAKIIQIEVHVGALFEGAK